MKGLIDLLFRITYFTAYRLIKIYWLIKKPATHGALVAVWYQQKILLVETSYHKYFNLPGGYLKKGETAKQAAIRELREEAGIETEPEELKEVVDSHDEWENRKDHVVIFTLEVKEKPSIKIDNREIVAAGFYSPQEIRKMNVFPPILKCLEK